MSTNLRSERYWGWEWWVLMCAATSSFRTRMHVGMPFLATMEAMAIPNEPPPITHTCFLFCGGGGKVEWMNEEGRNKVGMMKETSTSASTRQRMQGPNNAHHTEELTRWAGGWVRDRQDIHTMHAPPPPPKKKNPTYLGVLRHGWGGHGLRVQLDGSRRGRVPEARLLERGFAFHFSCGCGVDGVWVWNVRLLLPFLGTMRGLGGGWLSQVEVGAARDGWYFHDGCVCTSMGLAPTPNIPIACRHLPAPRRNLAPLLGAA